MFLGQGCRCREREGCSLVRGAAAGEHRKGASETGIKRKGQCLISTAPHQWFHQMFAVPVSRLHRSSKLWPIGLAFSFTHPPPPLHNSVQYTKFCSHLLTCFEHPLVMPAELMFTQMDEIHYLSSKINSPNYRSESVHMPLIEILVLPSTLYLSVMWQMHSIYIVIVALIFLYDIWRTQSFSAKCSITP